MKGRRRAHAAGRGRRGFTLLELMISATVFLLVAGAVVTSVVVSTALNTTNRETALASRAAQSVLEELKAVALNEVFQRYNATSADDPGAGASPGSTFAVAGLDLQEGDADGFVGAIEFPGDGTDLLEDGEDAELGMPRDLDGSGALGKADLDDLRILPVRVRVEWSGKDGERALELVTVLTDL